MASGRIVKDFSSGYQLIVEWASSATFETNSSIVGCKIKLYCPYRLGISARKGNRLIIDGTTYTFDTPAISNYDAATHNLATIYSGAIPHNNDGSKSVAITCYFDLEATISDKYYGTLTATGTAVLDQIPRQANLTAAPNFNDEENPTITYSNPAGNAIDKLEACISLTGAVDDVKYREIPKTGSSYTFNLTEQDRSMLRYNTNNGSTSRTVYFFLVTHIGGQVFYSTLAKTFTVINCAPDITISAKDVGAASTPLTGDANKIIKGFNYVEASMSNTLYKGAYITAQTITNGSSKLTGATGGAATMSGGFNNTENGTFVFSLTDSRGLTVSKTIIMPMVEYIKLTCDLTAVAPTTAGDMPIKATGNYYQGSFGAVNNYLAVEYRIKENNGNWGAWTIMPNPSISNGKYTAQINITGLNYINSYTIQVRAQDRCLLIESAEKKVKTTPVFDWGEGDFNINADLKLEELAVLKRHSNANAVVMSANGGIYLRPLGQANTTQQLEVNGHMGHTIISGYKYGVNNVLWSGALFMSADQSITLSQAVSKQPHGIVLVFSDYNSGANNYHWNSIFVDKYTVAANNDAGHTFILGGINNPSAYGPMGMKYIYISDTALRGNPANIAQGTTSGITYDNYRFVLRYVIGV